MANIRKSGELYHNWEIEEKLEITPIILAKFVSFLTFELMDEPVVGRIETYYSIGAHRVGISVSEIPVPAREDKLQVIQEAVSRIASELSDTPPQVNP